MNERASAWLDASLRRRLWFSEIDEHDSPSLPFALCRRGDSVRARHVACGVVDGREVRCFDLEVLQDAERRGLVVGGRDAVAGMFLDAFTDERDGDEGIVVERWECAVARADAECYRLSVSPEGVLSALADLAIVPDHDADLEAFNLAFEVRSDDRRFASDFLDSRMVQFLTAHAVGCAVEVVGNRILAARPAGAAPDLDALLALVIGVAERVPPVVRAMHPALPVAALTPRCRVGPDGVVAEPATPDPDGRLDLWPDVPRGRA